MYGWNQRIAAIAAGDPSDTPGAGVLAKVNGARNTAATWPAIKMLATHRARRDQERRGAATAWLNEADGAEGVSLINEVDFTTAVAAASEESGDCVVDRASPRPSWVDSFGTRAEDDRARADVDADELEPLRGAGAGAAMLEPSTPTPLGP